MYLLDTDVISWTAPHRTALPAGLLPWLEQRDKQLFLSSMTIGEIERGIVSLRRGGASAKAARLAEWRDAVLLIYGSRVLPFATPTALILGQLLDAARAIGRSPGLADLIIAATSKEHGFMLLTRNLRHYQPLGIECHDPFASLPEPKP